MPSDRKDFLEGLKVESTNKPSMPTSSFPDRDVYTCLKLMGDSYKVTRFLRTISMQETDEHKVSTGMSENYFYSINELLGRAEYDFRKGKIDINEFNNQINSICKDHNLDFNNLIEITDRIASLERSTNQAESTKLAEEIEAMVIEEHERRANAERED